MALPPIDGELVDRLEAVIASFSIARLDALAALPENAFDLRVARFGDVVAPAAPAEPELDFVNRIERLRDGRRLPDLLAYYAALGLRPWVEVAPRLAVEEIGAADVALVGFQTVLYGPPKAALDQAVLVRPAEDWTVAARLALEGHGVPAEIAVDHGPALAAAVEQLDGRFYLATLDGAPVAAAVLTIDAGIGYLALTATLPEYRGRGCQSALIAARAAAAAAAGCELVASTTAFGSQSQRNLERAGLRVAYTKPVLRLTPP